MRFKVYGRQLEILRKQGRWLVMIPGNDGKKRLADDIMIPSHVQEAALEGYLADLCHEWARKDNGGVVRLI